MINEALSAIINLLKLKKDAKKTDLEIEKLEREKKKEHSTISIASFEDIKMYDPRAREVFNIAERMRREAQPRSIPPPARARFNPIILILILVVALAVAYLVYKYAT